MDNFVFYAPTKVFFGVDEELRIGKILKDYNIKKILLHYGQGSIKKTGLYDTVVKALKEAQIDYVELGGVEPNPKLSLVREGVRLCKENNLELVLAVGGGSVIDSAKAISVGSKTSDDPWVFNSHQKVPTSSLKVGVILTLSASGSETSDSCVITNSEINLKRGFNCELNRPLFAIMNPSLTYTVSKYQTACGVVDIMMHTLERYFTTTKGLDLPDYISLGVLKSTKDAGLIAYNDPYNYDARATLMWAGSLSHNGLTGVGRKYVMLNHQIEHEISGMFDNVAHAAGLAAIFPSFCRMVYQKELARFARMVRFVFDINIDNDEEASLKGIEEFENLFKKLGMPTCLSDLNIYEDSFEKMANNLTLNGTKVIHGFIDLDKTTVMNILKLAK